MEISTTRFRSREPAHRNQCQQNQSYKIVTAQSASITISNRQCERRSAVDQCHLNFIVQNTGQVPLNPVKVVDTLPTGLNCVSSGTQCGREYVT